MFINTENGNNLVSTINGMAYYNGHTTGCILASIKRKMR